MHSPLLATIFPFILTACEFHVRKTLLRLTTSQPISWHFQMNESAACPGHAPLIGTNDNRTGQCLGKTSRTSYLGVFEISPILQNVTLRCHNAKSFCLVSALIAAIFFSMLGWYASIKVYSDIQWWFRSVLGAHIKVHLADSTKCRPEGLKDGHSTLLPM